MSADPGGITRPARMTCFMSWVQRAGQKFLPEKGRPSLLSPPFQEFGVSKHVRQQLYPILSRVHNAALNGTVCSWLLDIVNRNGNRDTSLTNFLPSLLSISSSPVKQLSLISFACIRERQFSHLISPPRFNLSQGASHLSNCPLMQLVGKSGIFHDSPKPDAANSFAIFYFLVEGVQRVEHDVPWTFMPGPNEHPSYFGVHLIACLPVLLGSSAL